MRIRAGFVSLTIRLALHSLRAKSVNSDSAAFPIERNPAPPHLAAERAARRRCLSLRRLARRGGPELVADAPARAAGRGRLAVPLALGLRRLARPPGRAGRARLGRGARPAARRPGLLARRLGALRRRGCCGRPGAVRARVARAAGVRERARRPPARRPADLRRRPERRLRRPAGALPARRSGRCTARRARPGRAALGQSPLRLGRSAQAGLPLVDRALPADDRALRLRADRPLPRVRLVLGGDPGRADGARRTLAAGPWRRALPRRRGRAGRAAADRGEPRDHHAGRRASPPRARLPGDARAALRVRGRVRQPASPGQPRRERRRLHDDARHEHGAGLVALAPEGRASPLAPRRARAALVAPGGGAGVARAARDRADPGRARARRRGANEPAGSREGQLAVATRAGRAHGGGRRQAARGDPPGGAATIARVRGTIAAAAAALLLVPGAVAGRAASPIVSIASVGDMAMAPASGGGDSLFQGIRRELTGDVVFGNLEGTLTGNAGYSKCGAGSANCFAFRAPPSYAGSLKRAGFTVLNLANNHALDFGRQGQADTVAALDRAHLRHTGRPGEIAYVHVHDVTIALLGFAPYPWAQSLLDIPAAQRLVGRAAERADLVVVTMHAGAEGSA